MKTCAVVKVPAAQLGPDEKRELGFTAAILAGSLGGASLRIAAIFANQYRSIWEILQKELLSLSPPVEVVGTNIILRSDLNADFLLTETQKLANNQTAVILLVPEHLYRELGERFPGGSASCPCESIMIVKLNGSP